MRKLFSTIVLCFVVLISKANNVQISSISQSGNQISFVLSWENSWNSMNNINPQYPNNWDAVWVFVKYQNNIDNLWKHAKLSSNAADHSVSGAGGVLQADPTTDSMGVFVRRTNPGGGNISSATVTLTMGPLTGTGTFNFKVFGFETVLCPQSAYTIGDSNAAPYFTKQTISSENAIGAGVLYTGSPSLPAAFPKGYKGFYMMKYEVSQEQYVDFLNILTYDQQANRCTVAPNSVAGTLAFSVNNTISGRIEIMTPGNNNTLPAVFACDGTNDGTYNAANDGQNKAMDAVGKGDIMAYLDWCGFRPMTEMEFEKGSRGTLPAIQNEFVWGSTVINVIQQSNYVNNLQNNENYGTVVDGRCNMYSSPFTAIGPSRCGIFASSSTGRASSGAGFYGAMELSGSEWEFCVAVKTSGATYTGVNGDGGLSVAGDANTANWPSNTAITDATSGTIPRGAGYAQSTYAGDTYFGRISDRSASFYNTTRAGSYGIRGVRTY